MFIVFEGLDGAGKSTQVNRLAERLSNLGKTVVTCRDPGSTELGNRIRGILLHKSDVPVDPTSEMLLFIAARCQLVREVIQPALQRGDWVLCDRFQMSTAVYQGHAGQVDLDVIRAAGQIATGGLLPDHTFVLDLDAGTAVARIGRDLDRMESRGEAYLSAVRNGFLTEAQNEPTSVSIVDATQPV